jgi:hypothetical protein
VPTRVARAQLVAAGELSLHDAVDVLQHDAEATGLVDELGQDEVQRILAEAFADAGELGSVDVVPDIIPQPEDPDFSSEGFWRLCREADERQARRPKPIDNLPDGLRELSIGALWDRLNDPRRHGVASSTLDAAEWLVRFGSDEEWRKWFDAHTAQERKAILEHLERRRQRRK